MTTANALQLLHTTAAYKAVVTQLLVEEANSVAGQLNLNESVPNAAEGDLKDWWSVARPPDGIGGTVASANYFFHFENGRLRSLGKHKWIQKISPPISDLSDLVDRLALLDADGAYRWAKQLLAALSVDVVALETKFPPRLFQVPGRRRDEHGRHLRDAASLVWVPVFYIGWGVLPLNARLAEIERQTGRQRPPGPDAPIYVEIFGTTKEVVNLSINDSSLWRRPALQVTNADELLGPLPTARHFVEGLFGGEKAYETVAAPECVEIWLLKDPRIDLFQGKTEIAGPVKLKADKMKIFSEALLNFEAYDWGLSLISVGISYSEMMDFGARLRFTRREDVVDLRIWFRRHSLEVTHDGNTQKRNFENNCNVLLQATDGVFPDHEIIVTLIKSNQH